MPKVLKVRTANKMAQERLSEQKLIHPQTYCRIILATKIEASQLEKPTLINPGDKVLFYEISKKEFLNLNNE